MTAEEIVETLRSLGSEATKRVLLNHGAKEPFFGVKIEELQKIRKRIGVDHKLALALYDTGISDAMYLAGLIADDAKMSKKDLQSWADDAPWSLICEYTVPWVAAGSKHGWALANKWIDSKKETVATSGWATLSNIVAITPDKDLDLAKLRKLLARVVEKIHEAPNRVRYTMNGFVIALGSYVPQLTDEALKAAKEIGTVHVKMGRTACKVPSATDYILKVRDLGKIGVKREKVKC